MPEEAEKRFSDYFLNELNVFGKRLYSAVWSGSRGGRDGKEKWKRATVRFLRDQSLKKAFVFEGFFINSRQWDCFEENPLLTFLLWEQV